MRPRSSERFRSASRRAVEACCKSRPKGAPSRGCRASRARVSARAPRTLPRWRSTPTPTSDSSSPARPSTAALAAKAMPRSAWRRRASTGVTRRSESLRWDSTPATTRDRQDPMATSPGSGPVQVRRVLTATPLARQHERTLERGLARKHPHIPFDKFDRKKYPAAALARAHHAQTRLALGEYTAVDLFAHIASAMTLNGVPFDLVAAASSVPHDEIRHADYAMRAANAIAGTDAQIQFDAAALRKRWEKPMGIEELDGTMLEVSAIGETLSCSLLSACRERAKDPMMHAVFSGIVSDEVHHARLGWYYFAWRAPQWTRPEGARL